MSSKKDSSRIKSSTLKATNIPYIRPKNNNTATSTPKKGEKGQTSRPSTPRGKSKQMDVTKDERFEEYNRMKIDELRKAKTAAIEELDFDLSEFIEGVIQSRVDTAPQDAALKGSRWIKERVEELLTAYFERVETTKREFQDKEIEIREKERDVYNKVYERHVLELEEVETERAVQLAIDEDSICGEAIVLQKQAKTLAKGNDFEGARMTAKKAEDMRIANVERRKADTNTKFDKELAKTLAAQENQLQILQDRLIRCIDDNQTRLNEEIAALQRESSVFIKSQLQKLIVDGSKLLNTNEQKAIFTSELTSQYMKDIKQIEKQRETSLPFLYP